MTYSTENDVNPKSITLLKSDSSVQSQIRPKFKIQMYREIVETVI